MADFAQRSATAHNVERERSTGIWLLVDAVTAVDRRIPDRLRRWKWVMLLPAVLVISSLAIGLADLAARSVTPYDPYGDSAVSGVTLENFERLFAGPTADFYRSVFMRTLGMSVMTALTATFVGGCIAYLIVRSHRAWVRGVAILLALVPFLMGEVVRAFGWLLLLGGDGFLAWGMDRVGLSFPQLVGTLGGVWIGLMQVMAPIAAFVMIPAIRRVDPDFERAAATLGAPPRKVWWHVSLPLLRPGLTSATVVVFALTMAQFAIPDVLGAGTTPFIANIIENAFFIRGNAHLAGAAAMVMLAFVIIAITILLSFGTDRKRGNRG